MTILKVIKQVDVEADKKVVGVAKCENRGEIVYAVMVANRIYKESCGFVFWKEVQRYQDLNTAMRNMIDDYNDWKHKQDLFQAELRAHNEEKARREREIKERLARAMADLGFEPCEAGTITSMKDKDYVFEGRVKR